MPLMDGFTRYEKPAGLTQPSGMVWQDKNGVDHYIWFHTDGVLYTATAAVAEAAGFDWITGATKIGGQ